jgi:hypothetical protein
MKAGYEDLLPSLHEVPGDKHIPLSNFLDTLSIRAKLYRNELETPTIDHQATQVIRGRLLEIRSIQKAFKDATPRT